MKNAITSGDGFARQNITQQKSKFAKAFRLPIILRYVILVFYRGKESRNRHDAFFKFP